MEVEAGQIFLKKIPHGGKEINFVYPAYRGNYGEVTEAIDKAGLKKPSSGELVSLIDDAWGNSRGEYESKILDNLMGGWLWEYTGNLYIPKSNEEVNGGVIIEHNPKIIGGKLIMDKNSLVQRLKENDPLVKFVPFGFKTGIMNLRELMCNPYILARYGNEGVEKIIRISSKYKNHPALYSSDSNLDKEKVVMSGFDNALDNTRLIIGANIWNFIAYGHCYGKVENNNSIKNEEVKK
jgi:hypothetical protein